MWHKITLVGRLGKDVELRYSPEGKAVASFSVAVSDGFDNKKTLWFRVTVWDKQAETCNNYLSKGKMVLVEGRMAPDPKTGGPRVWQRQDGTSSASYEIVASTVRFLSPKSEGGYASGEEVSDLPEQDDEIPF